MERLNSRRLPLQWPEAVALVQELAEGLAEGDLTSVPLVGEIGVAEDGQIGLPRSRAEVGSHPEPDLPAKLRRLLGELVNGGAFPRALLGIVEGRSADGQPIETLEDLLDALPFFERPSRRHDLRALAARLAQENEQERLTDELGALTRRTRIDEAAPHPDSKAGNSTTAGLQHAILIAGICVTLLVLVGIVLAIPAGPEPRTASAVSTRTSAARNVTETVADRADRSERSNAHSWLAPFQMTKAPLAGNPKRETPAHTALPAARAARSAPPGETAPLPSTATARAVVVEEPTPIRLTADADRPVSYAPEATVMADEAVYQSGDPGVVPAVLIYPKLPETPTSGLPNRAGTLDLIVDVSGKVERVRLRNTTPERRYRDYMMLASAKAWLFEPARKDGAPVRYRIAIPLTHFVP
jgi:hypothetical protein